MQCGYNKARQPHVSRHSKRMMDRVFPCQPMGSKAPCVVKSPANISCIEQGASAISACRHQEIHAGGGNFRVDPRFHSTSVQGGIWDYVTWEFPTSVEISALIPDFTLHQYGVESGINMGISNLCKHAQAWEFSVLVPHNQIPQYSRFAEGNPGNGERGFLSANRLYLWQICSTDLLQKMPRHSTFFDQKLLYLTLRILAY